MVVSKVDGSVFNGEGHALDADVGCGYGVVDASAGDVDVGFEVLVVSFFEECVEVGVDGGAVCGVEGDEVDGLVIVGGEYFVPSGDVTLVSPVTMARELTDCTVCLLLMV